MRKKLMELVDLGEPTSFPDLVYLGCTSRECKPNKAVIEENRKCSNHEFLLEQLKYCQGDDQHFKEEELDLFGEVSQICSQIV